MSYTLDDLPSRARAQAQAQINAQGRRKAPAPNNGGSAATPACPSTDTDLELVPAPDAKAVRRNKRIEEAEQTAYFGQINARLDRAAFARGELIARPEYPGADMIYHVANSNAAGAVIGASLVRQGVRRGYPDINVDVPRVCNGHRYAGLRIELKQPQGVLSDVAPAQRQWHERLRAQGYRACVCFGWREAWAVTCEYLGWEGG